jgi:hypothetical protein
MTKADKILDFLNQVDFKGELPSGIEILNPYKNITSVLNLCRQFYTKFYNDHQDRTLILGINPGRLGAGATGIPFTDTKRLETDCGIACTEIATHEPSSVFMYEMIRAYGGPELFYRHFYINSVCPLGFVQVNGSKITNYNYYDSKELDTAVSPFICENIEKQIEIAGKSDQCYCLGTGKNFQYLSKLNVQHRFFKKLIPLEHPRYIMQYKNKAIPQYIGDYLIKLKG